MRHIAIPLLAILTACSSTTTPALDLSCAAGMTNCAGACIDTTKDAENCGACGHACSNSYVCMAGACVLQCTTGLTLCNKSCVNVSSDEQNCGKCGNACPAGQVCSTGTCAATCASGQLLCGGQCTNPKTDPLNCGGCGAACPPGQQCMNGACMVSCQANLTNCNGVCTDLMNDEQNCGACSTACPSGSACSGGQCMVTCQTGWTVCSGACVNLKTDNGNCGQCGKACPAGQVCSSGGCAASCASPLVACGAACVDPRFDPGNCGGCGMSCPTRANATTACLASSCTFICNPGFMDCDSTASNGCETNIRTDVANCGGCGVKCLVANASPACVAASCAIAACNSGFLDCDKSVADGCEVNGATDASNCGKCGNACATGSQCVAGACVPVGTQGNPGASCLDILQRGGSTGDGTYTIQVGGGQPFQVFCDMTDSGGGWTLCFADKYQGKGTDGASAFNYLTTNWDGGARVFTRGNAGQGNAWGNFCPLMMSGTVAPTQVMGVSYDNANNLYRGGVCTLAAAFFNESNALVNLSCPSGTSLCSYNKPVNTVSVQGLSYACAEYDEGQNQGSSLNFNPQNPNADFTQGTIDYTNMHTSTCPISGDRHCTGGWCYECPAINSGTFNAGNLKTLLLYVR